MNAWAAHRRLVITLVACAVVLVLLTVVFFATLYQAPSCVDRKQNQDEEGIDCGGSCPYRCAAQTVAPLTLYTTLLRNSAGRTDLVASIENKNSDVAAKNVPYTIKIYSTDQSPTRQLQGVIDLPPHTTVPVFIPGVASGGQTVARAFLDISSTSPKWFSLSSDPRIVPTVSRTTIGGTQAAPRVNAVLTNPDVNQMNNVRVIVFVYGSGGNVIAASETVIASIPAQGQATALFTWKEAFRETPISIDVKPIISLP